MKNSKNSKERLIAEVRHLKRYIKKLESAAAYRAGDTAMNNSCVKQSGREKGLLHLNNLLDAIIENIPNMIFLKDL